MKNFTSFILLSFISISIVFAQATDFTTDDCNGITHNLFDSLNAGNVIVIAWVMPCGPCATYTLPAYSAVQSFSSSHPNQVDFYLVDDYDNTACPTLVNWGNSNNMPLNATFCSSDISMSDYGTDGMPKVVVLGPDAAIYYNKNDNNINFLGVQTAINDALAAPLGIENSVKNEFEISSYPNPVDNVLNVLYANVQSKIINFTIVDVLGKVVLSIQESSSYSEEKLIKSINISILYDGNYFLKVSSGGAVESFPFVVSH
jgi:hypothetical protein